MWIHIFSASAGAPSANATTVDPISQMLSGLKGLVHSQSDFSGIVSSGSTAGCGDELSLANSQSNIDDVIDNDDATDGIHLDERRFFEILQSGLGDMGDEELEAFAAMLPDGVSNMLRKAKANGRSSTFQI